MELNTITSMFGLSKTGTSPSLIKRMRKGDLEAVIEWCSLKKDRLYKIGWAHLENQYDIQDAFQNTILKIHEHINQLREDKFFDTWATRIFINECRSLLRSRCRLNSLEDGCAAYSIDREENYDLHNALKVISTEYREPIILIYYCGYSQEEIAELLDLPLGTVKSRIYRGLKALNGILREVDENGNKR